MNAIKSLILVFSIIVLAGCSSESDGLRIFGKLNNPIQGQYIYLLKLTDVGLEKVDSTTVGDDGQFEMRPTITGVDFFRLNFFDRQQVNLVLRGNEKEVEVMADGTDPGGRVTITGSPDTDLVVKMDSVAQKRKSDFQLLDQEAIQARSRADIKTFEEIRDQFYYLSNKHNNNLKTMIWESIPSLAALYGMNYIDIEQDIQFADSVAQKFKSTNPEHTLTVDLSTKVEELRRLAVGAPAPEITLPTPEGNMVSLSSLKGNYVLIDFWAAWCRPCRMENPNVVRLYKQYEKQNFEIFGVSLDRKRDDWLKAIEDDGLVWKHVSDLKYFNSEAARTYRINAIPATYLIDPDGKIMAKGLRGETLRDKLREIFG